MKRKTTKTRKEIITESLLDLEFITGLKQIKEYTKDEASRLVNALDDLFASHKWMNNARVQSILKQGMLGNYGEVYHINLKTVSRWIEKYKQNHQHQINLEMQFSKPEEKKATQDEIDFWIEIGKKRFREKYKISERTGNVPHISDWGPHWYHRMIEAGHLNESKFDMDSHEKVVKQSLRLESKFINQIEVLARVKNRVWAQFILSKIKEGVTAEELLNHDL